MKVIYFLLQKMVGVCSKKELGQLNTMLPLNPSTDVWKEAHPVTKITDSVYPFDDDGQRPTPNEVRMHIVFKPVGRINSAGYIWSCINTWSHLVTRIDTIY